MRVRLFARLRDIVGSGEIERDLGPAATIGDVWNDLVVSYPDLALYARSLSAARNHEYARFGDAVADGDEVAFLPPVSGGC